jgi:hypothetical protein
MGDRPDDGPEPKLGTPDDVIGFLRELRSTFRLEDKLLEARAAYWGLLPLVCLEQIVNSQELRQEHRSLLTMYYMAFSLAFRTNQRTCVGSVDERRTAISRGIGNDDDTQHDRIHQLLGNERAC